MDYGNLGNVVVHHEAIEVKRMIADMEERRECVCSSLQDKKLQW